MPTPIRPDDTPNGAPLSNNQTLRVLAFVLAVLPPLIPLNVILWRIATGAW
jgi:hypothetical protein